ncbi:MAG: metallophosphoesterase [Desulfobacterales bacterium]|nr:metallophosphoesterase [Desulfobacterales bacterium]
MNQPFLDTRGQRRLIWAITRSFLEADKYKHRKNGKKHRRKWSLFDGLVRIFGGLLKWTPLYEVGCRNAKNIVLKKVDLTFDDLPDAFNGYTILHLTDLHLDAIPGSEHAMREQIRGLSVDLCVMTGDYRKRIQGGFKPILSPMRRLVAGVEAADGVFATLGNHDSQGMVEHFEKMGITVLANETAEIARNGERLHVTGLDDPYYYYTDQALAALEETPDGFKIALVHAPSLFDAAADNGYRLYLCGHTHAGQICLPGGKPLILHLRHGRKYYRGLWRYAGMTGYTGQGAGTSGIPLRFNTQSEITLFRLNRTGGRESLLR